MRDVIYRQYDSRWGKKPYPTKSYTFANNGCGCCAVTHLIIEFTKYKNYTPEDIRPYMIKQGYVSQGQGTYHIGIEKTLERFGYKVDWPQDMKTEAFDILNKGGRAGILLMRNGTKGGVRWTNGGHYVAFLKYKYEDGKHWFYIKDSGARCNDGWFNYEDHMEGLIKQIWIVKLPSQPKTKSKGKHYTVGKTYEVVAGVNVRTGANSLKYRKVGFLKKGTKVKCLQTSKNGRWIKHDTFRWSCGRTVSGKIYIK